MAWTDPKTYVVEEATSTDLNTYQRDNITHLHDRPCCIVYNNATQTITANAWVPVLFNSEEKDTDSMHSTSVNTGRINLTESGVYLCWGIVKWKDFAGLQSVKISIIHSTEIATITPAGKATVTRSGETATMTVTRILENTGGYVELQVHTNGTGTNAVEFASGQAPYFGVVKLRDAT